MKVFLIALIISVSTSIARAQNAPPSYKMEGEASLMTNKVEYGISQTKRQPALLGNFWFNWGPQFRAGVSGNNVGYPQDDTHFVARLNGELKINFSADTDMTIGFGDHHYFPSNGHDGNLVGLKFNLWSYIIRYEAISNFMATKYGATSFSFAKAWDVFTTWKWENNIGYMMLTSPGASNYFYYETYIGTKPGALYYQIGATYNSQSSAWGEGIADPMFLILKATVTF